MYVKKAKNTFSYRWGSEEFIALLGAKVSESIGYKQTNKKDATREYTYKLVFFLKPSPIGYFSHRGQKF